MLNMTLNSFRNLILLFFLFALSSCVLPVYNDPAYIEKGIVDISESWDFYHKSFIISESDYSAEPITVNLPHTWNSHITKDGTEAGPYGFASYKKEINLDRRMQGLSLFMRDAASSYRLYVSADGSPPELAAYAGSPGKTPGDSGSEFRNLNAALAPAASYTFILEVSNFTIDKGGLWHAPMISKTHLIKHRTSLFLIRDFLLLGALLMAALYSCFQYLLDRDDRQYLYLSLLTLLIALRAFLSGLYIQEWMPGSIDFVYLFKLDYFTMIAGIPLFTLFIQALFHEYFNRLYISIINLFAAVFIIMLIFFCPDLIIKFQPAYWTLIIISLIYVSATLFYYRYINNDRIALFAAMGIFMLTVAIVHDILSVREISAWNFVAPYGYLLFIVFMAIMTTFKNLEYRREISSLHSKLGTIRSEFTRLMRENTSEIKNASSAVKGHSAKKVQVSQNAADKIQESLNFINENFCDRELNRESIASRFELSPSRMGKYFLICTGVKINDYIIEVRLNHAIKLLKETGMTVIEIAFESGFDNLSTFNRRFKERLQISPKEYRAGRTTVEDKS